MEEDKAAVLTPQAAFALATTWRNELHNCVRLESDGSPPAGSTSIFRTDAWVSFGLSDDRQCVYARATTIAWFALSCCGGFSGKENPQFWQQILNAWNDEHLSYEEPPAPPTPAATPEPVPEPQPVPAPTSTLPPAATPVATPAPIPPLVPAPEPTPVLVEAEEIVTPARGIVVGNALERLRLMAPRPREPAVPDERAVVYPERGVRFFPDAMGMPFPRVKLKIDHEGGRNGVRKFLGLRPTRFGALDEQVHSLLTQLVPFIRESHWQRRIPVMVDVQEDTGIAGILTEWLAAVNSQPKFDPIHTFTTHKFQITTIVVDRFESSDALARLEAELPLCEVEVRLTPPLSQIVLDDQLFPALLRRIPRNQQPVNPRDQLAPWRAPCVEFRMGSNPDLSILCSALPHIQTVQSLKLISGRRREEELRPASSSDWAWLGYALFHPDAHSRSGLTSINVETHRASEKEFGAFESMAIGNNLSPARSPQVVSFLYVEGYVEFTTPVWTLPGVQIGNMLQSHLSKTWVTVCVPSIEAGMNQKWLRVVNPGFGFGHLRRSSIRDWRSRPPGRSSIRALLIQPITGPSEPQQVQDQRVTILLNLLGGSLTALDWQGSQHVSTVSMQDLRRFCPSLRSLRIGHNGAVWSDPNAASWPQLRELELDIAVPRHLSWREFQHVQAACLPNLKALKLNAQANSFASYSEKLVTFLATHEALEFLSWSHCHSRSSERRMVPGAEATAKREFEGKIQTQQLYLATVPLGLERCLAFLGAASARALALNGNFSTELGALVVSFTTGDVRREIYIDV